MAGSPAGQLSLPTGVAEYEAWQRGHMDATSGYLRAEFVTRVGAVLWELAADDGGAEVCSDDAKVANRESRVWHGATENGP